jgi:hypothetical protein
MDQYDKDEEATIEFIESRKCNPNQFKMRTKTIQEVKIRFHNWTVELSETKHGL